MQPIGVTAIPAADVPPAPDVDAVIIDLALEAPTAGTGANAVLDDAHGVAEPCMLPARGAALRAAAPVAVDMDVGLAAPVDVAEGSATLPLAPLAVLVAIGLLVLALGSA